MIMLHFVDSVESLSAKPMMGAQHGLFCCMDVCVQVLGIRETHKGLPGIHSHKSAFNGILV